MDGNTTVRISQTGGTSPFTYSIDNSTFNSYDTVHIANGSTQDYYVKDAYNCTSSATNYTSTSSTPIRIASSGTTATCSCSSSAEGREVYLTNGDDLIAIINDKGHDLGSITATVYTHATPVIVSGSEGNEAALGRNWVLDFTGTGLTPNVEVKFPFTNTELTDLIAAAAATTTTVDDLSALSDIGSTQYEGDDEDSVYLTTGATMLVHHNQLASGSMLTGKYVTIGLAANGEHWLHGNSYGSPLPVELTKFTATAVNNTEVHLDWSTSLEINNNYFTIERSLDGERFEEVTKVNGAGNSTQAINYKAIDTRPYSGLSYYRLKQTDFDGQFTYSNIVAVTLGSQTSFKLYPNPTDNEMTIDVSNSSEEIKVIISDMNGRKVYGQIFNGNNGGSQTLTIQAKYLLPVGMYMVSVTTNGTEFKQKLVLN